MTWSTILTANFHPATLSQEESPETGYILGAMFREFTVAWISLLGELFSWKILYPLNCILRDHRTREFSFRRTSLLESVS